MIPVSGLNAGAGKAGLTQSSATCPVGLECRKVLFRHEVTTIPVVSCTLFPESQNGCEFAGGALISIVTAGSIWIFWDVCKSLDFDPTYDDCVHFPSRALDQRMLRSGNPFLPEMTA